jgi:putative aminopeptidase FrvX
MHSPIETLDLDDLERAVQLVTAFARRLEPGMSFTG